MGGLDQAAGDNEEVQGFTQETQQTEGSYMDEEDAAHLQKMTDYKSYAKGLMDIALMSANANQLRTALEYPLPFNTVVVGMISLSLVLQIVATLLLVIERMTCRIHKDRNSKIQKRKKDFARCHKYNLAISIIVILIIFVNIFITAFGVPDPSSHHNNNKIDPSNNNNIKMINDLEE